MLQVVDEQDEITDTTFCPCFVSVTLRIMGVFDKRHLRDQSGFGKFSGALSRISKSPFGHTIKNYARSAQGAVEKVSKTFQMLDEATGGAATDVVSAIPGVGSIKGAIKTGKKAFAAAKMVGASLKRARAEARGNGALADGNPFAKRKRSIR